MLPYDVEEHNRHCVPFVRACRSLLDVTRAVVDGEAATAVVHALDKVSGTCVITSQYQKHQYKSLRAAGYVAHCDKLERVVADIKRVDFNAVYIDTQNGVFGISDHDDYPLEALITILSRTTSDKFVLMFRIPRDSREELNSTDKRYMQPLFTATRWRVVQKMSEPGALLYALKRDDTIDPTTAEFAAYSKGGMLHFIGYR